MPIFTTPSYKGNPIDVVWNNELTTPSIRYGLVVRIPGSHPGGPGSIPGNGNFFSHVSFALPTKIYDEDGIRTHAGRATSSYPVNVE